MSSNNMKTDRDFPEIVVERAMDFVCAKNMERVRDSAYGIFFHNSEPNEMTLMHLEREDPNDKKGIVRKSEGKTWLVSSKVKMFLRGNGIGQERVKSEGTFHFSGTGGFCASAEGICAFVVKAKDFPLSREKIFQAVLEEIEKLRKILEKMNSAHKEEEKRRRIA